MNTKNFNTLTLGLLFSILSIGLCVAQNNTNKQKTSTEEILKMRTRDFENMILNLENENHWIRFRTEHDILKKGNSTRIKYVFNNRVVKRIVIEGVGETTPEDIRKGEFIVTVKPEKTTLYKVNIYRERPDGTVYATPKIGNRRIIVIAPNKYDKVMSEVYSLRQKDPENKLYKYLNELADGVPEF